MRRHQISRGWGNGTNPQSSQKRNRPEEGEKQAGWTTKTRDSECPQGSPRKRPQPFNQSRLLGPCLCLNSVPCCLGCQCQKARWLGNTHDIHLDRHRNRNKRDAMHTPWAVPLVSDTDERSDRNMREAGKSPFISVTTTPRSFTDTP